MIDDLDRRLIALLRADSRTPAAALAKALKVSRGTVQNRIDRLMKAGAIQGFTIKTRPDMDAHRVRAVMSIAIEGERSGAVIKALKGFPEVAAIHTTNGRWDLVAELEVETLAAFSATLDAIRQVEGIAATETSILLATQKL
ncbi:Lrp/AsnC family transcriptional regulator [uncultured Phenylobacterium sp.]|uniref:Lrp/AsnC family transcriptional regulator n=1 Tax=uncultured Phenylobacterium sp. TaxID=349273 RepID=UPI0025E9D3D0|nr:Lrp/AsnC family transcriptional regulator [uncultured Phenylobacterium sp.]